jgi:hypothetical protein
METQIETMRNSISALKNQKEKKSKKTKKKDPSASAPVTSSSKAAKKEVKAAPKKKAAAKKAQIPDDDVLSFEQKKDLSEAIQTLDGQKLERVIQIIHEGVPEIRDVSVVPCRAIYVTDQSSRARRKLSWRLIHSPRLFSPSSTTLSFGPYASPL